MTEQESLVTVFRSADPSASEDAAAVTEVLTDAGLHPATFGDDAIGVPVGAIEVRVPPAEEAMAVEVIAQRDTAPRELGDPGHGMDLIEVFTGVGAGGEMEAMSIRSVLDANDIPSVLVGTSQIPNFPFVVKVSGNLAEQARAVIVEARQAGSAAAEAAQLEGEQPAES